MNIESLGSECSYPSRVFPTSPLHLELGALPPCPARLSRRSGDTLLSLPLRRSHPRYPVQKIASYDYEGRSFLTFTLDLGLGGMKIKTHRYIREDERLSFRLVLDRGLVCLKGRIAYSLLLPEYRNVSGIQFLQVSKKDLGLLAFYLDALDRRERRVLIPDGR
ncbi:MAG: PilZ domain-containing protein [Deltaproteobacteria bacterium]|nr:PilZ domain-containing protein [Deltaproteobacteria bacterium]